MRCSFYFGFLFGLHPPLHEPPIRLRLRRVLLPLGAGFVPRGLLGLGLRLRHDLAHHGLGRTELRAGRSNDRKDAAVHLDGELVYDLHLGRRRALLCRGGEGLLELGGLRGGADHASQRSGEHGLHLCLERRGLLGGLGLPARLHRGTQADLGEDRRLRGRGHRDFHGELHLGGGANRGEHEGAALGLGSLALGGLLGLPRLHLDLGLALGSGQLHDHHAGHTRKHHRREAAILLIAARPREEEGFLEDALGVRRGRALDEAVAGGHAVAQRREGGSVLLRNGTAQPGDQRGHRLAESPLLLYRRGEGEVAEAERLDLLHRLRVGGGRGRGDVVGESADRRRCRPLRRSALLPVGATLLLVRLLRRGLLRRDGGMLQGAAPPLKDGDEGGEALGESLGELGRPKGNLRILPRRTLRQAALLALGPGGRDIRAGTEPETNGGRACEDRIVAGLIREIAEVLFRSLTGRVIALPPPPVGPVGVEVGEDATRPAELALKGELRAGDLVKLPLREGLLRRGRRPRGGGSLGVDGRDGPPSCPPQQPWESCAARKELGGGNEAGVLLLGEEADHVVLGKRGLHVAVGGKLAPHVGAGEGTEVGVGDASTQGGERQARLKRHAGIRNRLNLRRPPQQLVASRTAGRLGLLPQPLGFGEGVVGLDDPQHAGTGRDVVTPQDLLLGGSPVVGENC